MAPKDLKALEKVAFKEGGKKGVDMAGTCDMGGVSFFNISVESCEGEFSLLAKCMEGANVPVDEAAEERKGGSGHIGKMLYSAGDEQLAIMGYVPAELADKLSLKEWSEVVAESIGAEIVEVGETISKIVIKADPDNNKFPLKLRDNAISAGFQLLQKKGLVPPPDDSDDDVNYAEAAGVEW